MPSPPEPGAAATRGALRPRPARSLSSAWRAGPCRRHDLPGRGRRRARTPGGSRGGRRGRAGRAAVFLDVLEESHADLALHGDVAQRNAARLADALQESHPRHQSGRARSADGAARPDPPPAPPPGKGRRRESGGPRPRPCRTRGGARDRRAPGRPRECGRAWPRSLPPRAASRWRARPRRTSPGRSDRPAPPGPARPAAQAREPGSDPRPAATSASVMPRAGTGSRP